MKNIFIVVIFVLGFVFGIFFTGITLNLTAQNFLIKEVVSPYDFEKTVNVITNRIKLNPNWHVVNMIDQDAEVQKYGGKAIGKTAIIQYCSGKYASEMLLDDSRKKMAIFMPKTIAVYEKNNGKVYIALSNGAFMGKIFNEKTGDIIEKVSLEVEGIMNFMNFKFNAF